MCALSTASRYYYVLLFDVVDLVLPYFHKKHDVQSYLTTCTSTSSSCTRQAHHFIQASMVRSIPVLLLPLQLFLLCGKSSIVGTKMHHDTCEAASYSVWRSLHNQPFRQLAVRMRSLERRALTKRSPQMVVAFPFGTATGTVIMMDRFHIFQEALQLRTLYIPPLFHPMFVPLLKPKPAAPAWHLSRSALPSALFELSCSRGVCRREQRGSTSSTWGKQCLIWQANGCISTGSARQ